MSSIRSAGKRPWSVRFRKTLQLLVGTMGMLLVCLPLFSQGSFGRILGVVTDQSGGVVSGATVTVLDTQRGVARTLTTDEAGEYNAPTLIPGAYTVRAEAKGFKRVERQNVVLEVGHEVRIDLTLQPGAQEQTITITEAVPLVETTNATLGGTLENTEINDMPLNGRNYQNLMALRPGIMVQPGGSPWSQSTNNMRPDETVWMMDGVINVSFYDARQVGNAPSAFTDAATIVPIDAIQEFNTLENPKAEYGWKPGAVVNVGIRSGTNSLHGSAYAFGRYVGWDARNAFNPTLAPDGTCTRGLPSQCDKLPAELKQFGAVVGGPIVKDKLFFFAGYEGLRSLIGNIFVVQAPATGAGLGPANSMVDAITALQNGGFNQLCSSTVTTSCLSSPSLNLLGCSGTPGTVGSYACTGGLYANAPANNNNYPSTFPNQNVTDNGIAKIDYTINSKHRISGMLWTGDYKGTGQDHPIVNNLFNTGISVVSWTAVGNWIWTPSSTLVNEFRFGYDSVSQGFTIGDQNIIPDGSGGLCTATGCGGGHYPLNSGVTVGGGLPFIQISGFTGGGGAGLGNPNGTRPGLTGPSPYSDYQDSISYLRGKHAFKFGGEVTDIEADQVIQDFRGVLVLFSGGQTPGVSDCSGASCPLEDFFSGTPSKGIVSIGNGNRTMKWMHYAGFVQDDWRIKPRWMLNLGLRYEYASPIREVNNLFGNFDPKLGMVQQGQASVGPTLWKPDPHNFSPRVGFAWDVRGNGTTVVRAASSVIYATIYARPFMDNGPPNGSAGNIAQDPTGASCVGDPNCPAGGTFGGTINLGQPNYIGSVNAASTATKGPLNWNGVLFPQGGLSCTISSQCSLYAIDPHLQTPYVVNYNINIQHMITSNLSLEVGYVGNHGANLQAVRDINQCLLLPNPGPYLGQGSGTCVRPYDGHAASPGIPASLGNFPYLGIINFVDNESRSNYNSLQATLTKRLSHGLEFTAGYTYGHGLDTGSENFQGLTPQDSTHLQREYASSDFDVRHRLTVTASYELPGIKGYGQLLEGWKLNTIVTVQSPQPWLMFDTHDDFSTGGTQLGDLNDRWDFFGNPSDFKSGSSSIPWCSGFTVNLDGTANSSGASCTSTSGITGISTPVSVDPNACVKVAPDPSTLKAAGCFIKGNSVMTPPLNGTFGTMGRNIFRDSGFKNVDFSVFKSFKFRERFGAEFRVEFFNVFNHPIYANPYGSTNTSFLGADPSNPGALGCGCSTPDVAAGNPLVGSGSSRVMQLGLKLTF
jgi:Carboxypeptidase regulatory-like domain